MAPHLRFVQRKKPPMTEAQDLASLRAMIDADDNNYTVSLERIGDTATLVEDFVAAFEGLCELLRETEDPPKHLHTISILLLSTAYQFEKACLECLRGRLTDGIQITRRSIEAAAFAARIARHPHLAEVWFKASPHDESYDEYRKKFSPSKLFPADDELLQKLQRRWDYASRQIHTSVSSIARRASITLGGQSLEFEFRQFEVVDDDPSEPALSLLWILDTHLGVLLVFQRVFTEQLGELTKAGAVRMNAIDAKMEIHRELWRYRILGTSS
jgi:hypothetical protein